MNKNKNLAIDKAFNLAVKNHLEGKINIAQDLYNQVLEINPNHANASYNLAVLLDELGEQKKAIECYKKAIEVDPNYAAANNNLGAIYKELGENQKARDYYEKTIEINPNFVEAHNNLGVIHKDLGENQKAKSCYEKAIEINPNFAGAYNNLGTLFLYSEEYSKAKDCYKKAIEINPNFAGAYNNFGTLFLTLKNYQKARDYFEKAIKINPNVANTHRNLGITFVWTGEYLKALSSFDRVLQIDPTDEELAIHLSKLFSDIALNRIPNINSINVKKLFLYLFKEENINHTNIVYNTKLTLISSEDQNQLENEIYSDSLLSNKILQKLLKEELFHLLLQKSILSDAFLERLLTKIRLEILYVLTNSSKDILNKHFNFIISLAEQCWLNEYVYIQSEKENNEIKKLIYKIENNNEINELQISILGCYIPLCTSKIISEKLLNYESSNILFNDLINVQIKEPLREKELIKSIKSLDKIKDSTSIKVRNQYEEHPYPRWRFTSRCKPRDYLKLLNAAIEPNKIKHNNKFNNPNILVAGCGTGSHPISTTRYKNSNILAVDLSLTSLAYAKRKTEEFGIKNVEYMHADLLQLKKLNKKFDIIESAGVLHHMKDPIAGLKILLDLLEPHGHLRLGLYSEKARQFVVEARQLIKSKNYKNTSKDIKVFRQDILNKKVSQTMQKIRVSKDFYSTSSVRDLLFHVQEHRFTIPQISKILDELDLKFLCFLTSTSIQKEFSELFPNDLKNSSLDNWHEFEKRKPDTFIAMYQFCIKKNELKI